MQPETETQDKGRKHERGRKKNILRLRLTEAKTMGEIVYLH